MRTTLLAADSRRARCLFTLALAAVAGCADKPTKAPPAATVSHAVTESQLTAVTLAVDAVKRLGIETAAVESTSVSPTRTVGGEVVVPPGQSLAVSAPVAGTVLAPDNATLPMPGARVSAGQLLLRLVPLPPQHDLATAEARLQQAQAEADRTAKLYVDHLVSARDNERAQADLASARSARDAIAAQQRLARGGATDDVRGLTPIAIVAPHGGVVRALNAGSGQAVAAGAPLVEIARLDEMWVRVPMYAGDVNRIAMNAEASVRRLGDASSPVIRGRPVAAPPSADPTAASVDVFYQIAATTLRPGERVEVTLPLATSVERALTIDAAALVRDMSGGTWIYERLDSVTFARRRVEVARVAGRTAVLAVGPRAGTPIVIAGAAELFGTEFGAGK